jgi:hypothetical protein
LKRPGLRNQNGQQIIEAVLLIVVFMGFATLVASFFNKNEILKELIGGPFQSLAGVMQNGVWATRTKGAANHPTSHFRHIVVTGEGVQ